MSVVPMVPGMPLMQFYPPMLPYNFYTGNTGSGSRNEEPWSTPFQSSMMNNMQQGSMDNMQQGSMDNMQQDSMNNMQQGNKNGQSEIEEEIIRAIMLIIPFFLFPANGWQGNYYPELWDTLIGTLGFNDIVRLGSQYLFPQSPAPTYED